MTTIKYDIKYYRYLDMLRDSGITNMFGAAPYLADVFDIDKKEARNILSDWMDTYPREEGGDEIDE